MKLSTALRRGAACATPPHPLIDADSEAPPFDITTSVLAEAWRGLGHARTDPPNGMVILAQLSAETGVDLVAPSVSHPITGLPMSLSGAIVSLNRNFHWTHKEIIAWLAQLGY